MKERYIATLIGCAVGDTLGMPVEGWLPEQIRKYAGVIGEPIAPVLVLDDKGAQIKEDEFGALTDWNRDLMRGDYTDDTILTLAVAQSLAEKGYPDIEDMVRCQLAAYQANRLPDGRVTGGFGKTTRTAFERLLNGTPLLEAASDGAGNAPPMKLGPLGLYIHATGDYNRGIEAAEIAGKITHSDRRSVTAGVVQAHAVQAMLSNASRDELLGGIIYVAATHEKRTARESDSLTSRLRWVMQNKDTEPSIAYRILGNCGLVTESYPFTIFMVQRYWDEPLEGLLATVNFGGDCDTTGAMYGMLSGARHGPYFPPQWVETIRNKEPLISTAERIYQLTLR